MTGQMHAGQGAAAPPAGAPTPEEAAEVHAAVATLRERQHTLAALRAEERELASATGWRRGRRQREAELGPLIAAAELALLEARRALGPCAVGADPGRWGVFSGGVDLHLEDTLANLPADAFTTPEGAAAARELLSALPELRLAAHEGDTACEGRVQEAVVALAARAATPRHWRRLVEHLPGTARPLPTSVEHLEPAGRMPARLLVLPETEVREDGAPLVSIDVRDLAVPEHLAGRGLGTAILQHLCRYADSVGAVVTAALPHPHGEEGSRRVHRLSRWYARHGFAADAAASGARPRVTRHPAASD